MSTEYQFNVFTGTFDLVSGAPAIPPPVATTGEALSLGDVLTVDSAGEVVKASSNFASGLWRVSSVAIVTTGAGSLLTLAKPGDIVPMRFASAPLVASNGELVFLSSTLGEVTLTPPLTSGNVVYVVGILQGADGATVTPDVLFQPDYVSRRP